MNALPSLSTTSTNNGHSAPINNSSKSTSTSTNGSAPSFFNIQTKVGTFKWIDKSNDPNKPKFILRMTVNNKMKYKKYFNKITSPLQLTGFKISSSKIILMMKVVMMVMKRKETKEKKKKKMMMMMMKC